MPVMLRLVLAIVGLAMATPAWGAAPVNWGDDPATVALWTFDGNGLNVSTSRTYCAAGEADLTRFANQSALGPLVYDGTNTRQGSQSIALSGGMTLAAQSGINNTRCLRSLQPDQWTLTMWMRNTAVNTNTSSPYPMPWFNRDESSNNTPNYLVGTYVTYVNTGTSGTGNTYACVRAVGDTQDYCTGTHIGSFTPSTNWRFLTTQYTGTALRYQLEARTWTGAPSVTHALGKNPDSYTFQLSHIVSPGNESGVIGNLDEVWWTAAVLTQSQVCRVRSVGVQGSLGWCDGSDWADCTSDFDCDGREGSCNVTYGKCVGRLGLVNSGESVPSGCSLVADLGACDANLTAPVGTTPTPTVTATPTVTVTPTVATVTPTPTRTATPTVTSTSAKTPVFPYPRPTAYAEIPPLRTFWVDKNSLGGTCNNSNPGTSITAPKCTAASILPSLQPGDKVWFRGGPLPYDTMMTCARCGSIAVLDLVRKGTAAKPIVLAAYPEASSVQGQCVGGSNHLATCTADSQCPQACVGGQNHGAICTTDSECPGASIGCAGAGRCIRTARIVQPPGTVTVPGGYGSLAFGVNAQSGAQDPICIGGTNDEKACTVNSECPGGACDTGNRLYTVLDGFTFTGWDYIDTREDRCGYGAGNLSQCLPGGANLNRESSRALRLQGVGNVVLRNMLAVRNYGGSVILPQGFGAVTIEGGEMADNFGHGWASAISYYDQRDTSYGQPSVVRNLVSHHYREASPWWSHQYSCFGENSQCTASGKGRACSTDNDCGGVTGKCSIGNCSVACCTGPGTGNCNTGDPKFPQNEDKQTRRCSWTPYGGVNNPRTEGSGAMNSPATSQGYGCGCPRNIQCVAAGDPHSCCTGENAGTCDGATFMDDVCESGICANKASMYPALPNTGRCDGDPTPNKVCSTNSECTPAKCRRGQTGDSEGDAFIQDVSATALGFGKGGVVWIENFLAYENQGECVDATLSDYIFATNVTCYRNEKTVDRNACAEVLLRGANHSIVNSIIVPGTYDWPTSATAACPATRHGYSITTGGECPPGQCTAAWATLAMQRETNNLIWNPDTATLYYSGTPGFAGAHTLSSWQAAFPASVRCPSNQQCESFGLNDLCADPLFVDPANGDFRLQPLSPAINRARTDFMPSFDLTGATRETATLGAYDVPGAGIVIPTLTPTMTPTATVGTPTRTATPTPTITSTPTPTATLTPVSGNVCAGCTQAGGSF